MPGYAFVQNKLRSANQNKLRSAVCCKQFSCWLILTAYWLHSDVAQHNVNLHQLSSADRVDTIHKHIFVHIYVCIFSKKKNIKKY